MTLSALDENVALIVVDLQKAVTAIPVTHPITGVIGNAAQLAAAFRARRRPVVLVTVDGAAPGRTDARRGAGPRAAMTPEQLAVVDELQPTDSDLRITKRTWGAFTGTGLHDELAARGITQTVLAGVSTSIGVESTARAAHEHGYHVVLVEDAMTDTSADAHDNTVQRIFPRLGEVARTADVLAQLG